MPYYKGSWYSQAPAFGWFDKEDRPGSNALGVPDWQQGIALPSRGTLGQWYNVTPPGGGLPFPMQQTDIGPAKWTGRGVDISAAAAHQMGYTPKNFPTDAAWKVEPRDEPRGLGSPAGRPVQAGDLPDNADETQTAVASGPPQGQKMPASLMDMFEPRNAGGEPASFADALQSRSNSLIGLGLGMLQPRSLAVGAPVGNAWTGALEGYQQGAAQDTRQAYLQQQLKHQKTQEARQAAMDRFNMGMREKEFTRSGESDFAKVARDLGLTPGTPEYGAAARKYVQDKTEPPAIVWQEDANGNKVPYLQNPRNPTNPITQLPIPGQTATAGNPYGPSGKMTTDEGKTALFADRAATAHAAITKAENINAEPGGTVGAMIQQNLPAGMANVLVSGERGKAMDAQRAFVNALLRRESGAAINAGEFTSYAKEYFPQLGDTPDQLEAKRQHRAEVIAGLARESGKGYRPTYSFDEKGNIKLGAPTYAGKGQGATPSAVAPDPTPTPAPAEGTTGDPLAEAKHAIRMGAPRAAVIERLAKRGIRFNPKDLD